MGRLDREIERLGRIREMTKEMTPEEAERFVYTACRGGGTKTRFYPRPATPPPRKRGSKMGRLDMKKEQKDFHSVMKECLKIRFPTWFQGGTTTFVCYSDPRPATPPPLTGKARDK